MTSRVRIPPRTKPPPVRRLGRTRRHSCPVTRRSWRSGSSPAPILRDDRLGEALDDLGARFGDVAEILEEPALREVEESTRRLLADIRHGDTYMPYWAADSVMARLCYLACRLIEPETVVETGVAYGVSSAFILRALEMNGHGMLFSWTCRL